MTRLTPFDLLRAVSDSFHLGALRFREEKDGFAGPDQGPTAPPATMRLEDILAASQAMERNEETAGQIALLLETATSLQGLRPKCSIILPGGELALAKFPSVKDVRPVTRGEALALEISRLSGASTADFKVIDVSGQPVLLVRRFDRNPDAQRKHCVSAFTMLETGRRDQVSYADMANATRRHSADARSDLREMFRRLVVNVLVSNLDDHLGNFSYLYHGHNRWLLSPNYDVNPFVGGARVLHTPISHRAGAEASIEACVAEARHFDLTAEEAWDIVKSVGMVAAKWRDLATSSKIGMTRNEAELFTPAFDHRELHVALTGRAVSTPARVPDIP